MKKIVLIVLLGILIFGLGIGGFIFWQRSQPVSSPVTSIQPTNSPLVQLKEWVDQAEYKFSYPSDLILNPHEEDTQNYSHVELTDNGHPGKMIIWVKDTTASNIEDFIKKNKIVGSLDSSLGEEPAKKYFDESEEGKFIITAIRNGYLYQIETIPTDNVFWSENSKNVLASFKFVTPTASPNETVNSNSSADSVSVDTSTDGGDFEGEEVIE